MKAQLNLTETDRVEEAEPTSGALTEKDRQGLAMAWVFSSLGLFLVLGGLALLAAWVFQAGFVGWLISMGLMGLVIVVVVVAVNYYVLRPAR